MVERIGEHIRLTMKEAIDAQTRSFLKVLEPVISDNERFNKVYNDLKKSLSE